MSRKPELPDAVGRQATIDKTHCAKVKVKA